MPSVYALPKESELAKVMQLCMALRDKPKEGYEGVDTLVSKFSQETGFNIEADRGNCEQSSTYAITTTSGIKLEVCVRVQGDYFRNNNDIKVFANAVYFSGREPSPAVGVSSGFYLLDFINAPPVKVTAKSLDNHLSSNNGFKCVLRNIDGDSAFYEVMKFQAETHGGTRNYNADCFIRVEPVRDSHTGNETRVKLELEIRVPYRTSHPIDNICKKHEAKQHYMPAA